MSLRTAAVITAVITAVIGGGLLLFRWIAGAGEAVHWVGLGLVALALAPVGARLVSGVLPLRLLVAIAFPVLAVSLVELVRPSSGPVWFDGVLGIAAVLVAVGVLAAIEKPAVVASRHRAH